MDALVARCSRYSGWDLSWRLVSWTPESVCIRISDPKDPRSICVFGLFPGSEYSVREVYGRTRHWAISFQEQTMMVRFMRSEVANWDRYKVDSSASFV
jgi:hypothetical protein